MVNIPGEVHVGLVAPPYRPVSPQLISGGIEQDARALYEGRDEDIRFHLFAAGGSVYDPQGIDRLSIYSRALWDSDLSKEAFYTAENEARRNLIGLLAHWVTVNEIDILHFLWEDNHVARQTFDLPIPKIYGLSCTPNSSNSILPALVQHRWGSEIQTHFNALTYTHARALTAATRVALGGTISPTIEVLPYGVACENIKPSDFRLSQTTERPTIKLLQDLQDKGEDILVQVAGKQKQKGQLAGIRLFQRAKQLGLTHVKLVIVGEPGGGSEEAAQYAKQVDAKAQKDDDIHVFGGANQQEKWELFRFALGSLYCSSFEDPDYLEAYCRTLVEGPLVGTPVVGYASDTFREIMYEGVTGLEFGDVERTGSAKQEDIEEGARKILQLHTLDRIKCYTLARQTMGADRYTKQLMRLYRYMAAGYPLPRTGDATWPMCADGRYEPFHDPVRESKIRGQEWYDEQFGHQWHESQLPQWFDSDPDLRKIPGGVDFIREFMRQGNQC